MKSSKPNNGWFDVSKDGLRQLMESRDKSFVVKDLIQNSWDEPSVTHCAVTISPAPDARGMVDLEVVDNAPEGFHDLTHAFTMFAKSRKRKDKNARGRFNLGEKQVLALCEYASILTTKGEVLFNKDGTRTEGEQSTPSGSVFSCRMKMSKAEMKCIITTVKCFLPPKHITTEINGFFVEHRDPVSSTKAALTTEYEHKDGSFKRTKRQAMINIHEVRGGERPTLYEMGIPVVALEGDDKYHYDIQQRVPLNSERDNVTPAFLRDVRAEVVNVVAELLTQDEASADWAREAAGSDRITEGAFKKVVETRYGDKVASFSPVDTESSHAATAQGFTVLTGGALSKSEWNNNKRYEAVVSSAKLFPTANLKGGKGKTIPLEKWTPAMEAVAAFAGDLALELLKSPVEVCIARDPANRFNAWYGSRQLTFNLAMVGHRFFNEFDTIEGRERVLGLTLHEISHEYESNHLSEGYYRALTKLAAKAVSLALTSPRFFTRKAKKSRKAKAAKMCKCGKNPATTPHSCPAQQELNDNYDPEYCTCCKECEQECAQDA